MLYIFVRTKKTKKFVCSEFHKLELCCSKLLVYMNGKHGLLIFWNTCHLSDLSFHREQSNINMGGPPVQVRSHSKYVTLNSDQPGMGYQHQRMFPQHDNSSW